MMWLSALIIVVLMAAGRIYFRRADKRYQAGKLSLTAVDGNGREYYLYGGSYVQPARVEVLQLSDAEELPPLAQHAIDAGPKITLETSAAEPVVQ